MLRRLVVLSLLLLAGCAQNPAGLPLWQAKEVAPPSLQYLGVAGYLLRWQGEALLFAPSFSNPATLGQPPMGVQADAAKIDEAVRLSLFAQAAMTVTSTAAMFLARVCVPSTEMPRFCSIARSDCSVKGEERMLSPVPCRPTTRP